MRSFIVSIIATLAFALFAYAAPMPAVAAPVYAIAARADEKPSIGKTMNKCIDGMKPHTDALAALKVDVEIDVIVKIVADIKIVLGECMDELKLMVNLKFEDIFCDSEGVALSVTVFAGLCVQLILCLFQACSALLLVVSVSIKVQVCAILVEVCALLGEIIVLLLDICVSLRVQIIACILPQIAVCVQVILYLKIDILIKCLGL